MELTEAQIKKLIDDAAAKGAEGVLAKLPEIVTPLITEANKPTADALAALATKVEENAKPKPGEGAPGGEGGDAGDEDKGASGGKKGKGDESGAVAAALKKVQDDLAAMRTERDNEQSQKAVAARVSDFLNTKRPNLPPAARKVIEKALLKAAPKDDAAIEATLTEYVNDAQAMGVDTKPFMADYKGEGGKAGDPASDAAAAEAKKIKDITERAHTRAL